MRAPQKVIQVISSPHFMHSFHFHAYPTPFIHFIVQHLAVCAIASFIYMCGIRYGITWNPISKYDKSNQFIGGNKMHKIQCVCTPLSHSVKCNAIRLSLKYHLINMYQSVLFTGVCSMNSIYAMHRIKSTNIEIFTHHQINEHPLHRKSTIYVYERRTMYACSCTKNSLNQLRDANMHQCLFLQHFQLKILWLRAGNAKKSIVFSFNWTIYKFFNDTKIGDWCDGGDSGSTVRQ